MNLQSYVKSKFAARQLTFAHGFPHTAVFEYAGVVGINAVIVIANLPADASFHSCIRDNRNLL